MMSQQKRRQVYRMTEPIELRFKVQTQARAPAPTKTAPSSLASQLSNIWSLCSRRKNSDAEVLVQQRGLALKFVDKLNNECIVIGNQHRLDVLFLQFVEQVEIDTRLIGRVSPNFQIKHVRTQPKKSNVFVAGVNNVQAYRVDFKADKVVLESSVTTELPIIAIQPFSESILLTLHQDFAQVYSTENSRITVRERVNFGKKDPKLKIFSVPKMVDKFLNVFFCDPEQAKLEGELFTLFKCQITQQGAELKASPIIEVYRIDTNFYQLMQLHNYDKQTFIVNLVAQILVIKRLYPIDTGQLKHRTQNSRLIYLQNRNLLHVCDTRVQAHSLTVLSNSIQIASFDCINLSKPSNSKLFSAVDLAGDRFVVIYTRLNNRNPRELKYWLTGTVSTNVKLKLKDLMSRTKDTLEIQDVAEKMGLTKKEIFLELWNQSTKSTKEDFDILLETEDYHTIIAQIKNTLKKQSISFKELERVERACLKMLEKQITEQPTQANIRRYIKSHFFVRKFDVELNIQRRKIRDSQLGEKFKIGIQEYQDIRKRNIKKYIVDLMKTKKRQSKIVFQQYISGFRFVLRAIFPEFLEQIIKQLGEDLQALLKIYPDILPTPQGDSNIYNQNSGIWANITSLQWDKSIFVQKIQTIDNVQIINDMMKKDWFRWDWLSKHDLIRLKRREFEKEFEYNREEGIYYVFFDLLFSIIKSEESLKNIVDLVQEKYIIPRHLVGRLFLYWELHKFFEKPGVLPGYNLKFQEFLKLKQDQIYQLVFFNQKNCKKLILADIKDIYNSIVDKEIYDQSILTYFKAPYSTIADLKYLLNRINNQKIEFHTDNSNLCKVLVDALFYKLKFDQSNPIPIKDLLVYFQSIPLDDEYLNKLRLIAKLNNHTDILYQIHLQMNLNQFFENGTQVLLKVAEFYIEEMAPASTPMRLEAAQGDQDCISLKDIMGQLLRIRDNLFKDNISDHTVLEVLVSLMMNYDDLVPDVERMIKEEGLLTLYDIADSTSFLERIVEEKVNRAYQSHSKFQQNQLFITSLLNLLPDDSQKKKQHKAHLQLGILLSSLDNPPKAPLIISSRFIQRILSTQKADKVKALDIDKVYELMCTMGMQESKSSLYQVLILKYLEDAEWDQAIHYIRLWNQATNNESIVFSALLATRVGEELSKDLKNQLADIIIIEYAHPDRLLDFTEAVIHCDQINRRKRMIGQMVIQNQAKPETFYQCNTIMSDLLKNLAYPINLIKMKQYFQQVRSSDVQLLKNDIYYLYYRLLLCQPFRAYQLHNKYFQWMDLKRVQFLITQMQKNPMFNSAQTILFFYRSLLLLFSSNYLGQQFRDPRGFFNLSFKEIDIAYSALIVELGREMAKIGEEEKFSMIRVFKKLYIKRLDKRDADEYSMEVGSDEGDSERNDEIKRVADRNKRFSKQLQTKKTLNPMRIIEPTTPLGQDEEMDQFDAWRDAIDRSNSNPNQMLLGVKNSGKPMTSSVRYPPKKRNLGSGEKDSMKLRKSESIDEEPLRTSLHAPNVNLATEDLQSARSHGELDASNSEISNPQFSMNPSGTFNDQKRRTFGQATRERLNQQGSEGNQSKSNTDRPAVDTGHATIHFDQSDKTPVEEPYEPIEIRLNPVEVETSQIQAQSKKRLPTVESVGNHEQLQEVLQSQQEEPVLQQPKQVTQQAPKEVPQETPQETIQEAPQETHINETITEPQVETPVEQAQQKQQPQPEPQKQQVQPQQQQQPQPEPEPQKVPEPEPQPQPKVQQAPPAPVQQVVVEQKPPAIVRPTRKSGKRQVPVPPPQNIIVEPEVKPEPVRPMRKSAKKQIPPPPPPVVEPEPVQEPEVKPEPPRPVRKSGKRESPARAPEPAQQVPAKQQAEGSGSKAITRKPLSRSQNRRQMQEQVKKPEPEPLVQSHPPVEIPAQTKEDSKASELARLIISDRDYSKLQQELLKRPGEQLPFLQEVVQVVFQNAPFKTFLQVVQKLKTINLKFQAAVRAQNLRVMRNAFKAQLNFDLRSIFTPDVLYLSGETNTDIESHNRLIFDHLKPRIKELVNDINLFVISKLMSLSFNFNKSFEFRVQYYYLEGLMNTYLTKTYATDEDAKMDLEKIEALLSRLPINMTAQRFPKLMDVIGQADPKALGRLLEIFQSVIDRKADTTEGDKFRSEIGTFKASLAQWQEQTKQRQ